MQPRRLLTGNNKVCAMSDNQLTALENKIIVVSGLSGSGKSIALHALEDAGYDCIDNLPVRLFAALVDDLEQSAQHAPTRMAIGIDARMRAADLHDLPNLMQRLEAQAVLCEVLFLEAEDAVLLQRFNETRRRHPLTDNTHGLLAAIAQERQILAPLRNTATLCIDTSHTSLHELRKIIRGRMAQRDSGQISLMLQSFGFKHGAPLNADFVFDARCLPNPHWQAALRPLTGRDKEVVQFLEQDDKVHAMLDSISQFIAQWLPCFEDEGRSYLTIAVGCTGGQHRSVYLVEKLDAFFNAQGREVLCIHRELT